MASAVLEQFINDTLQRFGGRESLQVLNQTYDQAFNMSDAAFAAGQRDPFMMQDIEMGQGERIFWILLFSFMVLVAAGGNIVVIHIVSTNKEMKSVTNYFLVNLSLADTMVSTLNVIFNFISMLNSHWPFGNIYCKISNFIAILSISASVFTLTAISCDRYNAIIHPLRPRMSHRHAIGWILLIWTLSSALALPNLIYSVVVEDRLVNENLALTCTMIWPDGRYPFSSYDHIYNIVILVVTYLVPILTMAILYYRVGKELWGHQAIGEDVEKQARAVMAKKKIVKMMIVVVIIFALCWLPYHGFFVVNYYLPMIFQDVPLYYQRCYLIMYWLAMSNSMYNPIIIYFMNSKFRHKFKRVLWFIFCCRAHPGQAAIKSENANQNHLFSGPAGGASHSGSRLVGSIHASSKRVNGNGGQHSLSRAATTGGPRRSDDEPGPRQWPSSVAKEKAATTNQQHYDGSIEVVVMQPESPEIHRPGANTSHECEPFINDGGATATGDKDNTGSPALSETDKIDTTSGALIKHASPSTTGETSNKEIKTRSPEQASQDKVWI